MHDHAILSRILSFATWILTALALAATALHRFRSSGQYWFDRDRLIKAGPAMPGWTAYEARVAAQARQELREALGDGF